MKEVVVKHHLPYVEYVFEVCIILLSHKVKNVFNKCRYI